MPGKHSLLAQLDRYSKEFIIARMKLLHLFLNRIVNHPILSCDKSLHIFLTCKPAVSKYFHRAIINLKFTNLFKFNLKSPKFYRNFQSIGKIGATFL